MKLQPTKDLAFQPAVVSKWRVTVSIALLLLGACLGVVGLAMVSNQFGNTDELGLIVFGCAGWLLASGVAYFFLRSKYALIIGVVGAPISILLLFVLFWIFFLSTAFQHYEYSKFAAQGFRQIQPAKQMNNLYADCRHYTTFGPNDTPLFNSVAYFGGRYELTMQVPYEIFSDGRGAMTGPPTFYLSEVGKVSISPSGQTSADFSDSLIFDIDKWKQVYKSDGDFSKIGFKINPTGVPNFKKYADASRPSD